MFSQSVTRPLTPHPTPPLQPLLCSFPLSQHTMHRVDVKLTKSVRALSRSLLCQLSSVLCLKTSRRLGITARVQSCYVHEVRRAHLLKSATHTHTYKGMRACAHAHTRIRRYAQTSKHTHTHTRTHARTHSLMVITYVKRLCFYFLLRGAEGGGEEKN